MSTHNIHMCFYEEFTKISFHLSSNMHFICSGFVSKYISFIFHSVFYICVLHLNCSTNICFLIMTSHKILF